ncbi:MAG: hypothetical protein HYY57_00175 [Candidatus Omnitrophica bacterium]|nr:hypothetical protein [Candidatus Omnitrophota bacterium]
MEQKIQALLNLLLIIRKDPSNRKATVWKFIRKVQETDPPSEDNAVWELLGDLSVDLDYYEPNEKYRREDASFYGEERLEELIDQAFARFQALGVQLPHDPVK